MQIKFTDRNIRALPPPPPGVKDYFVGNTDVPDFFLRVGKRSKHFVIQNRKGGRHTIGPYPALPPAKALERFKVLAGRIAAGEDLRAARKAKAHADSGPTLEGLIDFWGESHGPRRRHSYVKVNAAVLKRVYARLLKKSADSITTEQLEACLEPLADRPAAARIAGERVKTLYRWGGRTRKIKNDPTKTMVLPEKTKPRKVCPTGEEARLIWRAAGTLPAPDGPLIKFLMSSVLRLREAAEAPRSEFSPDFSEMTILGGRMKEGEPHIVWLPPIVQEMLRGLPQFENCDYLFSRNGKRAITGFTALKQKLDKALAGSGVKPFTFHDFRRAATTWLVRNGTDSIVADRLLAHTQLEKISATASNYNVYSFESERKIAIAKWVDFLAGEEVASSSGPTPQPMLPPPDSEAEPSSVPLLAHVKDQLEALEAKEVEREENFISLVLRIGSRQAIHDVNRGIFKREAKAFAPKFLATLKSASDPRETAISVLIHTAAFAHLDGITVLKRGEVEAQRTEMSKQAERWSEVAKRADAEAEQGREIGQVEFAARAATEAQKARAIAALWENSLQVMVAPDDVCVVRYRKGDPGLKHERARGVYNTLLLLTETIFGAPEAGITAAYATAATGVVMSRWRANQAVRGGKVGPRKARRVSDPNVLDG